VQLWFTEGNLPRFFLIPDEAEIPLGKDRIENTLGRLLKVDLEALVRFEIELGEARQWFEENEVAIEAVREAKRARIEQELPRLQAMAEALESAFDDELVAKELAGLGLDPAGILNVERGHAFVEDLVGIVRGSGGRPNPDALRKVLRKHGHKHANRLLRGEEAAQQRLLDALERLIRHGR